MRPARAPLSAALRAFRRHGRGGVHPRVSRSSQAVGADRRCTSISLICTRVLGWGGGTEEPEFVISSGNSVFFFLFSPEGTSRFRGFTEAGQRWVSQPRTNGPKPGEPSDERERAREGGREKGWGEGAEEGRPRVTPKCTRLRQGFCPPPLFFQRNMASQQRTINAFTVATVTKRSIQPASYRTRLEFNTFRFITDFQQS